MAAAGHFGRWAAAVNVENVGTDLLHGTCRIGHQLRVIAAELHGNGAFFGQKFELVVARARPWADTRRIGHFARHEATTAEAQNHPPKNAIRHPYHGGKHNVGLDADMSHVVGVGEILIYTRHVCTHSKFAYN